jgi:flagellar hook-associated protein 2
MSSVGSATSSSSSGIDLSSLLEVATGSSSEGLNVTAAVSAAITAARAPEVQWQAQQATITTQGNDLSTLNGQVTTLENDLAALNSFSGAFSTLSATSSDPSIATANATLGAAAGTHVVNVTQLATTDSWYSSNPVGGSGLSAGTFNLQVGSGTATPITVAAGESLTQLASAINSQSAGVTASVITDASGSRLSIVSNNSGSSNNIKITPVIAQATATSSWNTASVSDSTGFPAAGSFSIQVGNGTATPISFTSGESLNQLASAINGQSALGVTASVVSDGSGTGTSHLEIVNTATGDGSGMTIPDTSPQFTESSTPGQNALLTVDGIPITSATNAVTGVIPGVTINLNGASLAAPGTSTTLSITSDTSAITSAINQFVTDYNTVIGSVNSEFTYNATNSTAAPLAGDSAVSLLQNALLGAGSYSAGSNAGISTLGALGITMNNDGTLSVDSTTLGDAVQNNSTAVEQFFEGSALNGFSSALDNQLQGLTDASNGAFTVDLSSMKTTYNDLETQINDFETNYISSLQTNLTAEYDAAEIALQEVNTTKQQINAELGNNSSSGN